MEMGLWRSFKLILIALLASELLDLMATASVSCWLSRPHGYEEGDGNRANQNATTFSVLMKGQSLICCFYVCVLFLFLNKHSLDYYKSLTNFQNSGKVNFNIFLLFILFILTSRFLKVFSV